MKASFDKILIVGLFLSDSNREKINRSAADQLAELLSKNGFQIIKVSDAVNKAARLFDTVSTIFKRSGDYKIAIVPLYGTFFSYWWSYISCLLLKFLNKKIVLIIHGGSIPERMKTNASKYIKVIKLSNTVVCPSGYILNEIKRHGVESILIENVIKLNDYQFHYKEKFGPCILWMRTLHEIYNPEMAVRVTALLKKTYPDIKLVLAGREDGSLQEVKALIKQLNIEDAIELPGYLKQHQKNEYAQELDIYICTNRIDNAPVSLIEMMVLGLPVVSVNVGGIPNLITDKVNGMLVELDDDKAMAKCIISIIENPSLGKELVMNGLIYSKQFDEEPVLEKWKDLLQNLHHQLN